MFRPKGTVCNGNVLGCSLRQPYCSEHRKWTLSEYHLVLLVIVSYESFTRTTTAIIASKFPLSEDDLVLFSEKYTWTTAAILSAKAVTL